MPVGLLLAAQHEVQRPPGGGPVAGGQQLFGRRVVIDAELHRRSALLVLDVRVGLVLQERVDGSVHAVPGGHVQRRLAVVGAGVDVTRHIDDLFMTDVVESGYEQRIAALGHFHLRHAALVGERPIRMQQHMRALDGCLGGAVEGFDRHLVVGRRNDLDREGA